MKEWVESFLSQKMGKHVGGAFYLHKSMLPQLPILLQDVYAQVLRNDEVQKEIKKLGIAFNLMKFDWLNANVSLLSSWNFEDTGHPWLNHSICFSWVNMAMSRSSSYEDVVNPYVYHRKELMVSRDYSRYKDFRRLTEAEEKAGLLKKPPGRLLDWNRFLLEQGYRVDGHDLIKL